VIRYLLVAYGLGGAWLWWLAVARGTARLWVGMALAVGTLLVAVAVRVRSQRLRSRWEWISSRAITHAGQGQSRWHRDRSDRPDDPGGFEAHLGGGW